MSEISPEVQQAKLRFGIVGNTPALIEAIQRALTVAPIDLSVLITGESGTGKEFFPQIIHQYSSRKHSKYIAVNCGAIPEGTIDSELFGHEKGSFTGAVASRKGYFEEADGGTIFLDEVAELPLTTQARLLRVLETGEFLKVGSSTVQKTNIRVVAATNVDMRRAIADGKFREDLFYRLSTVQISIPPLRERGNDILLLARKFSSDFEERYRLPSITLTDEARRLLLAYSWPGNVRQLKNAIEQISLFEAGRDVTAKILSRYLPSDAPSAIHVSPTVRTAAYEQERDMLFGLLFRLQSELADLKKKIEKNDASIQAVPTKPALEREIPSSLVKIEHLPHIIDVDAREMDSIATHKYIDVTPTDKAHQEKEKPQTLEDTEREMIKQSLLRNDGRRKATAQELNISERTLYRKIKEYGLD